VSAVDATNCPMCLFEKEPGDLAFFAGASMAVTLADLGTDVEHSLLKHRCEKHAACWQSFHDRVTAMLAGLRESLRKKAL
jgi:hypothetical protein